MNAAQPSKPEIASAINLVLALSEAIRTAKQIPSGHLYAMVMGVASIQIYDSAIALLKRAGLVSEKANLLTWIGPEVATEPGLGGPST